MSSGAHQSHDMQRQGSLLIYTCQEYGSATAAAAKTAANVVHLAQVVQPVADMNVHVGAGGGGGGHLAADARLQVPVPLQRPPRPNGRLLQVHLQHKGPGFRSGSMCRRQVHQWHVHKQQAFARDPRNSGRGPCSPSSQQSCVHTQCTCGVKACTEVESAENISAAVPPAEMQHSQVVCQPHIMLADSSHRDTHGSCQQGHQFSARGHVQDEAV